MDSNNNTPETALPPEKLTQLDTNIKGMLGSGASQNDVMKYASDFKQKFGYQTNYNWSNNQANNYGVVGPADKQQTEIKPTLPDKVPTQEEGFGQKVYDYFKKGFKNIMSLVPGGSDAANLLTSSYSESHPLEKPLPTEQPNQAQQQGVEPAPLDVYKTVKAGISANQTAPTLHPDNPYIDAQTVQEMSSLGYEYRKDPQTQEFGFQQTSMPSKTPEEVKQSGDLASNSIAKKINVLKDELDNLEAHKDILIPKPSILDPKADKHEINPEDKKIYNSLNTQSIAKKNEIASLLKQQEDSKNLYSSIYHTQVQEGSQPQANITSKIEEPTEKNIPVSNYQDVAKELQNSTQGYKNLAFNPDLETNFEIKGLQGAYVGDQYQEAKAMNAYKYNPKDITDEQKQLWSYQAKFEDANSLQSTVDRDQKVLSQYKTYLDSLYSQAREHTTPVDEFNKIVEPIHELISSLTDNIEARQSYISTLKTSISTNSQSLVKYYAYQEAENLRYANSPIAAQTGLGVQKLLQIPSNLGKNILLMQSALGTVSKDDGIGYLNPEQTQGKLFTSLDQLKTSDIVPNYLDKKTGQYIPISEKPLYEFEDGKKLPTLDFGVLSQQAIKSTGECLVLGGLSAGIENIGAEITSKLATTRLVTLAGGIAEGSVTGKVLSTSAQLAQKAISTELKFGVPSMLLFGKESVEQEMKGKNLSSDQAVTLGLFRANMEGAVMAVDPIQMETVKMLMVEKGIESIEYRAAYRNMMEANWETMTHSKMSDKFFNYAFNPTAQFAKSLAHTTAAVSIQQDLALGLNHLTDIYVKGNINPAYQGTNDITQQKLIDNTVSAIATMFPLSMFHAKGIIEQTKDSRYSSLYTIVHSPEYFLNHIDEKVKDNTIDKEEGLRQTKIIRDASIVHEGLSPDYKEIDDKKSLPQDKKDILKYELFKNKLEEKGLVDRLSEADVKNIQEGKEEPTKEIKDLTDYLEDNAKTYQGIKKAQNVYDNLPQEDKDALNFTRIAKGLEVKYSDDNLAKMTHEDLTTLQQNIEKTIPDEQNPYLKEYYQNLHTLVSKNIEDRNYVVAKDAEYQQQKTNDLPDEEYQNFVNKGVVTKERLNSIADKLQNGETINPREQELTQGKGVELSKILQDRVTKDKPDTTKKENIQDSDYKEFKNTGVVSPDILQSISDKATSKEPLSPREQEIYTANKADIDNLKKEESKPVIPKTPPIGDYQKDASRLTDITSDGKPIILTDEDRANNISTFEKSQDLANAKLVEVENKSSGNNGGIRFQGKLLVDAVTSVANRHRESQGRLVGGKWKQYDFDDNINPTYLYQYSKDFGVDTKVTFVPREDPFYFNKAKEDLIANKQQLIDSEQITEEEFNNLLNNPNNHKVIEIHDSKGRLVGNVHALSYIRQDRIPETIDLGEDIVINNWRPNLLGLQDLRNEIFRRQASGESLDTKINGKRDDTWFVRADKQFKPVKEAFKSKETIKNIELVRDPSSLNIKGNPVVSPGIKEGDPVIKVTDSAGKAKATTLKRTSLDNDFGESLVNAIKFHVEYATADIAKKEEMDEVAENIKNSSYDQSLHPTDIRNPEDLRNYLESIIFMSPASKFLGANIKDNSIKDLPFIDLHIYPNGTPQLTFSDSRMTKLFNPKVDYEDRDKDDFNELHKIGVHNYVLNHLTPDMTSEMEADLRAFISNNKYLNLSRLHEQRAVATEFQIPILKIRNGRYTIEDSPNVTNSGENYRDFMLNNLHSNIVEHEVKPGEYTYHINPVLSFDTSFGENDVKDLDKSKEKANLEPKVEENKDKTKESGPCDQPF